MFKIKISHTRTFLLFVYQSDSRKHRIFGNKRQIFEFRDFRRSEDQWHVQEKEFRSGDCWTLQLLRIWCVIKNFLKEAKFSGLLEELKIPAWIATESTTGFDLVAQRIGKPIAPSFVPGATTTSSEKMTFFERMGNVMQTVVGIYLFHMIGNKEYESIHKTHPHIRDWRVIKLNHIFVYVAIF